MTVDIPEFMKTKAPAKLGKSKAERTFEAMLFWSGFITGAICAFAWCLATIYFAPQNVIHSLPMLGY